MSMSRMEFWVALNNTRPNIDALTTKAYAVDAQSSWERTLSSSPHGKAWNTSFHASDFPGDDPKACPRKSLYTLMGLPAPEPFNRFSMSIMDMGKDIEERVVSRWHKLGVLLSNPPWAKHQTGYEDSESWLTGSCDAVVLPSGWRRPHVIEVKTKSDEHIAEMKAGTRTYDEAHRKQLLTYISMFNELSKDLWPDLDPVVDGSLYYISRANLTNTVEFFFNIDEDFFKSGVNKLITWKDLFLQDALPERPKDWKWTDLPCRWCKYKKHACKPDMKDGIELLSESNGISWAEKVYGSYEYNAVKDSVISRWS